jgi:hypothetical protein
MNHKQTRTHKIQHGSNLGDATAFPFIVFYVPNHGANTQMSFCPETPNDTLPSSLTDSNVSLKWKQRKSKELMHTP